MSQLGKLIEVLVSAEILFAWWRKSDGIKERLRHQRNRTNQTRDEEENSRKEGGLRTIELENEKKLILQNQRSLIQDRKGIRYIYMTELSQK